VLEQWNLNRKEVVMRRLIILHRSAAELISVRLTRDSEGLKQDKWEDNDVDDNSCMAGVTCDGDDDDDSDSKDMSGK
jgi:hypothetical protein